MTEEEQQPQQEEVVDSSGVPRIPYSREDLINAHNLRNTEYKEDLTKLIDQSTLYASAKRALKTVVNNYFSSNWFLANLEKGGKNSSTFMDEQLAARLNLELDLLYATNAFCPSDLKSPDMANILKAIQSHHVATLSRAKGANRERILNSKFMTSQETTFRKIDELPMVQQQRPEKKGILSFLRGK